MPELIKATNEFIKFVDVSSLAENDSHAKPWSDADELASRLLLKSTQSQRKLIRYLAEQGRVSRVVIKKYLGGKSAAISGFKLNGMIESLRRKCLRLGYEPIIGEEWEQNKRGTWTQYYKIRERYRRNILDLNWEATIDEA